MASAEGLLAAKAAMDEAHAGIPDSPGKISNFPEPADGPWAYYDFFTEIIDPPDDQAALGERMFRAQIITALNPSGEITDAIDTQADTMIEAIVDRFTHYSGSGHEILLEGEIEPIIDFPIDRDALDDPTPESPMTFAVIRWNVRIFQQAAA